MKRPPAARTNEVLSCLTIGRVSAPNRRHGDDLPLDQLQPALDREDADLAHAMEIMHRQAVSLAQIEGGAGHADVSYKA